MSVCFKSSVPYRQNCFQLFGFDIMIDDKLNAWLIEVNQNPSMTCDSPLDLKVKSSMVADMLNLIGIVNHEFIKGQGTEADR